ncbi:hypothetical protein RZN05_07215 [Sphingomonas sp. HF-S4]|uniref:Uncharacterized protein n=1 Tax=Sphingomonas agrestis TaxID=3080540 RepID=A0ABU3Y5V2_9SPHN|nr:hypothetical protein [Sphingomonas sp. HF-S4]MDV3456769.1 hypothetical protein [Sphingomonas sp. HF-S4]
MRSGWFGLAVAGSVFLASGGAAQETPGDDITVTGQREVPRAEASRFVRDVATTVDGQFARFHEPVCPMVIGIPENYAEVVTARVRAVARDAGVPLGGSNCAPNILVIVANDADQLVKSMRKDAPGLFRGLELDDIRKAMREGPVHVWSTVETRNEDRVGASAKGSDGGTPGAPGGPPTAGASSMLVRKASILELSTMQAAVQSVVVIDDDAVLGKTLTQVADYVAMRTLAGARPPKVGAKSDTILTLFEPGVTAPPGLTLIDASYLKGVYDTRPQGKGVSQASTIARTITEDSRERSGMR